MWEFLTVQDWQVAGVLIVLCYFIVMLLLKGKARWVWASLPFIALFWLIGKLLASQVRN